MASTGAWMGSTIDEAFLRKIRRNGFLGTTGDVEARAPPAGEISPKPKKGKFVMFYAHVERGLGLPTSSFFSEFLHFYGLQPHHLGANCITQLSCFVTLCETYLGDRKSVV